MALRIFNGTNFDKVLGTPSISTSSLSLSPTFQACTSHTAPDTTHKITGVLFFVNSVPSIQDIVIEVRESGVSKVSAQANQADLQPGFNYIRFTTPYQFTTTAANAYIPYIKDSGAVSSGSVARDGAAAVVWAALTYDLTGAVGATDDIMVGGFHNSGMTPQTLTPTGTGNSWGSGQNKQLPATTGRVLNCATTIFNGGKVKFDTAADCKVKQYGNVIVFAGGVYDQRPGASSVSTLEFTNDVDADFALMTASSGFGGQILTTGKTVAVAATYQSGAGTAASPATFTAAHGFNVGDQLVIGWGGDYTKNEVRYVISIPSPTQVVWSTTAGGSEAALTYSHTGGFPVCNMTRNSVIKNTDTTKGFSIFNSLTGAVGCDFSYTRLEYPNCLSGRSLALSSTATPTPIDGLVLYNNSANGRTSITYAGSVTETINNVVLFNTRGTNYSAQSGLAVQGQNKTVKGLYHYAEPGSTTCCAALSIAATATNNVFDGIYSSGANASSSGSGYAVGLYGSGNTFNNVNIDGARVQGVLLDAGQGNEWTNSRFGTVMTNSRDIAITSGVYVKSNFLSCSFGSATLLYNYQAALPGSDIGFQDMDGNTSKHRWYTTNGSFWASGAGLTDTTVRTPGSLALAIKPENATDGTKEFIIKVPANPTSLVMFYGYIYRNSLFSAGDIIIDLFLPGTLTTGTPDATYMLPTTTGSWLPFLVSAYNSAAVPRYAKIRITAKSAVAGAIAFLDDIYDAGTGNKVAGLDLWDVGHISPIIVAADYSSIPDQTRKSVWGDVDVYSVGSKGKSLADAEVNTDVTQAKVDQL